MNARPVDLAHAAMIVTGASPGSIGYATARVLASWGAAVTITTRTRTEAVVDEMSAAVPAGGMGSVVGHPLDLTDAGSVIRFADWFTGERGGRLDVLINNAGVHLDLRSQWKQPHRTDDGHEIHWRTNYLGPMHLTRLLLPTLLQTASVSGDARVVNVVSKLHAKGRNEQLFGPWQPYDSWTAYGVSKLALVHATRQIQDRFAASGVQAYCVHPGSVFSNIADRGLAGNRVIGTLRRALAPVESRVLLSPEQGAQTSIHCATAPGLAGGGYFRNCVLAEPSAEADDAAVAARLWDETSDWVHAQRPT
jgi:NAD(P)-dependent dehydrogenase (short-subunit alcohol dehydrogenase family)